MLGGGQARLSCTALWRKPDEGVNVDVALLHLGLVHAGTSVLLSARLFILCLLSFVKAKFENETAVLRSSRNETLQLRVGLAQQIPTLSMEETLLHVSYHQDGSRELFYQSSQDRSDVKRVAVGETTDGRGKGLFAYRDIAAGSRVLAEIPLLEWHGQSSELSEEPLVDVTEYAVNAAVAKLSARDCSTFFTLFQNPELHGQRKHAYGVWASSALPIDDPPNTAVFAFSSLANHSCAPNAHLSWNAQTRCMTCHALAPIRRGQEVCVSYLVDGGLHGPRLRRRAALLESFGFLCSCARCALRDDDLFESDARQSRIAALDTRLSTRTERSLRSNLVAEQLSLLEEESMMGTDWEVFARAREQAWREGDLEGARAWAHHAAESARTTFGEETLDARQQPPYFASWHASLPSSGADSACWPPYFASHQ